MSDHTFEFVAYLCFGHLVVVQDQSDLLLEPVSIWDVLEDGAGAVLESTVCQMSFMILYTPENYRRLNMLSKGKGKNVVESANFWHFWECTCTYYHENYLIL